jgi:PiT family inorganic phosphate transporter
MITTLVLLIGVALVFDFINGFHDAANSIATVVSTRVLSPRLAVAWAAFFNFISFMFFSTQLAATISKGVHPSALSLTVVASGLVGAIIWDLLTWWWGLPTSSSHALLGAFAGAAVVKAGFGCLNQKFFLTTAAFIVVSPILGGVLAWVLMRLTMLLFGGTPQRKVDRGFRRMQLVSAAAYSLGHGANDAQKTMGIIMAALIATGHLAAGGPGQKLSAPLWVVLSCQAAMGLGTLSGGWRIVRTMGMKITKLQPVGGFCAETAGAFTLFLATQLKIPVSTTHTITGAIIGVGSVQKLSAVRWGVAGRILWAWILTVPGAAAIAAITYLLAHALGAGG